MPKTCSHIGCTSNVFSKKLCKFHWARAYAKPIKSKSPLNQSAKSSITKKRKPVNKRSKKLAADLIIYNKLRLDFLKDKSKCEIGYEGCTIIATEVHHTKGRGKYLLVVITWKAVCRHCHTKATKHSKEAIEEGHSQRRNTPVERTIFYKPK